jgi:mannose-1-phosphate guanylyltransferase
MFAVIMAGGRGSRFWPRSRKKTSKQILNIVGKHTMIQDSVLRLLPVVPEHRIFIITNSLLEDEIRSQLPMLPPENVIAEPVGRSTAACVGLAAIYLRHLEPGGVMATFAADHLIRDVPMFQKDLIFAARLAREQNALVLFGIPPERPETGFGYIRTGEALHIPGLNPDRAVRRVAGFVEKPDMETAKQFFESTDYLVNSGMFVWPISTIMEEIHKHMPAMGQGLERIAAAIDTPLEFKALGEEFPRFDNISIDKGVMEHTDRAVALPARFGWSDLGSWSSLYDVWPKDENNNVCIGRKLILNTTDTLIYSPKKLVAAVGVKHLVIVETDDAILVCHKDQAQDVSELVDMLRRERMEEFL